MALGIPLEPAMPSPFRAGSRYPRTAVSPYGGSPGYTGADRRLHTHGDDSLTEAFLKQPWEAGMMPQ